MPDSVENDRLIVRLAERDEAQSVAATLASAFVADPFIGWCLGSEKVADHRLVPIFAAIVRQNLKKDDHLTFVEDGISAAAIWKGIDDWRTPLAEILGLVPAFLRHAGIGTIRFGRVLAAAERQHPTEPHYYLSILGTADYAQGRGIGGAVLRHMLDRCDAEGVPAYLESSNPTNYPFYERYGFVVERELTMPKGCPPIAAMRRDPR